MLCSFSVKNFKSFKDWITLDLSRTKSYEFNPEGIRNGLVNTALIYGYNGVGKSNLALAVMDIVLHLTDKNKKNELYENYLNAESNEPIAEFIYTFQANNSLLTYCYGKTDYEHLVYESLRINDKVVINYNRRKNQPLEINLSGTETLNKNLGQIEISVLKYIKSNAVLGDSCEVSALKKFLDFVDNILLFWNHESRGYQGYRTGNRALMASIIEANHFEDLREFLRQADLDANIGYEKKDDEYEIYFFFGDRKISFWKNASTGMRSLILFYHWLQQIQYGENPPSLVFIDEFDAFYHSALARYIVKKIKNINKCQFILTTHDTSVMTNEILRPDCYFLLYKDNLLSVADSTDKELREAHNLEKMYRANIFNE